MKWYNKENYKRYSNELKQFKSSKTSGFSCEEIINNFLWLPEKIARSFNTENSASGVLNIEDLIQEGMLELCKSAKLVNMVLVDKDKDAKAVVTSYLSTRIRGAIRRAINNNRASVRLPERKITEIRTGKNYKGEEINVEQDFVNTYFSNSNSLSKCDMSNISVSVEGLKYGQQSSSDSVKCSSDNLSSLVVHPNGELWEHNKDALPKIFDGKSTLDSTNGYNYDFVVSYLKGIFNSMFTKKEAEVLEMWCGVGCEKKTISQIAEKIKESESKVFRIKEKCLSLIRQRVDKGMIIDFLYNY